MNLFARPARPDALLEGYGRFRQEVWPDLRQRYQALARRDQSPRVMVIACADARVDPLTIFGAAPGELFIVRNVANIVPPYQPDEHHHGTSAALEYAVRILKVSQIVVLGHSRCEGVRAILNGAGQKGQDFLEPWLSIAEPVLWPIPRGVADNDTGRHFEEAVVRLSLDNIRTFPWVAEKVRSGHLTLNGYRFDIASGALRRITAEGSEPVESAP